MEHRIGYVTYPHGDYRTKKSAIMVKQRLEKQGKRVRLYQLKNKQWRVNVYF